MKKPDELSNSLPTYVEATQSLDPVVVSEKEKSLRGNTRMESEEKEERAGMKRQKDPDFDNYPGSSGPVVRPSSNKVPEFSKSQADSSGPVVPEASPVFSIVTIRWPTAVDNFYEDVENPYGLTRSNSFRLV